jgi:excisionase family DNA binding protein
MNGIKLQIDATQLEAIIRKVVGETLTQMHARRADIRCTSGPEAVTEELLLKAPAAAKALGISERALWTLTRKGDIPHVKIGRSVRYSPDDLRAWIGSQKSSGSSGGSDHPAP